MMESADHNAGPRTNRPRFLPHLNVRSPFLVHIYNLGPGLVSGKWLKRVVERDVGRVVFVETFEAWKGQRIGSVIFEFADAATMDKFLDMPKEWIYRNFKCIPSAREMEGEQNREMFFATVLDKTGVDLLGCNAVPPMTWAVRVGVKKMEPGRSPIMGSPQRRIGNRGLFGIPFPQEIFPPHATPLPLPFARPRPSQPPKRDESENMSGGGGGVSSVGSGSKHHVVIENIPPNCGADELESLLTYLTSLSTYITTDRNGKLIGVARFLYESDAGLAATFWTGEELRGGLFKLAAKQVYDNDARVKSGNEGGGEGRVEQLPIDFDLIKLSDD